MNNWDKSSWRSKPADQMPKWDSVLCESVVEELSRLPSLVFAGEIRNLIGMLKSAAAGHAFVLQCGNCAEEFSECHGPKIHEFLKIILQMSLILACIGGKRVIRIGRIAGQYAKPRSRDTEHVGGMELPSYRGDMVNAFEPTLEARTPDPRRMIEGYFRSAATLNLIRAFMQGGYGEIQNARNWHSAFADIGAKNHEYIELVHKTADFMRFSEVFLGEDSRRLGDNHLFTSHEALLLEYEEALTRFDTTEGGWYDTSAHMLWIGERTRYPDHAHIEFIRGILNPVGVKIGPGFSLSDMERLYYLLNSSGGSGRLVWITRFGASHIQTEMPRLVETAKKRGWKVIWMCDPMHGNTYVNEQGRKTRDFDVITDEVRQFFLAHQQAGTMAGGIHLELSGTNVSECSGGRCAQTDNVLTESYQSACDPRLSAEQGIELAFAIARMLHAHKEK